LNKPKLTKLQLLKAVQHALNTVPQQSLRGNPAGFKDTYELAEAVDWAVMWAESNKEEGDA
jgi:hypothetical protein